MCEKLSNCDENDHGMQKECYKIYRLCFTIDLWHYMQTLWILLLFWVLRVWGIDCSCKRWYLAMQATHVCCWAFRQKGLTLELRGYLHGRERQQRAKEIRAAQTFTKTSNHVGMGQWTMSWHDGCSLIVYCSFGTCLHKLVIASGWVCRGLQVQKKRR